MPASHGYTLVFRRVVVVVVHVCSQIQTLSPSLSSSPRSGWSATPRAMSGKDEWNHVLANKISLAMQSGAEKSQKHDKNSLHHQHRQECCFRWKAGPFGILKYSKSTGKKLGLPPLYSVSQTKLEKFISKYYITFTLEWYSVQICQYWSQLYIFATQKKKLFTIFSTHANTPKAFGKI